jgi:hypothetical protein
MPLQPLSPDHYFNPAAPMRALRSSPDMGLSEKLDYAHVMTPPERPHEGMGGAGGGRGRRGEGQEGGRGRKRGGADTSLESRNSIFPTLKSLLKDKRGFY